MQLNRNEFVKVLSGLKPGLAKKELLSQSQSFIFSDDRIYTCNDTVAVSIPFKTGMSCAVKAEELHKILSKLKAEEIEVSATDTEFLVSTKNSKSGIQLEAEIKLEHVTFPDEYKKWSEKLMTGLKFVKFSASTDMSKPILTYVCIRNDAILATDNFRIMKYKVKIKTGDILIPAASIDDLAQYNPTGIGRTPGWLHFQNEEGIVYSIRTSTDGKFADLEPYLSVEGIEIQFPEGLADAVETAMEVFSKDDRNQIVTVAVSGGNLVVSAKGAYANHKERLKIKSPDFKITVEARFLLDLLPLATKAIVGESRLKIEGEDFEQVIMLAV